MFFGGKLLYYRHIIISEFIVMPLRPLIRGHILLLVSVGTNFCQIFPNTVKGNDLKLGRVV